LSNKILEYLKSHESEIFSDLKELVSAEATSEDLEELKNTRKILIDIIKKRLGVESQTHPTKGGHDPISFSYGDGKKDILLIGHFDTVIPIKAVKIYEKNNKLFGPGVMDMKGGLISIIWAIKAYKDLGIKLDKKLKSIFNCDEEIGSPDSVDIIIEMAKDNCVAALVLEPAVSNGDLKTGRKGRTVFVIKVHGKASHAGLEHNLGVNAIEEIAREIQYIHTLTDYDKGTTLSVGVISGGTKTNVVPDEASMEVDCRYTSLAECERIKKLISEYKPTVEGSTREVALKGSSPPMEQTEAGLELFKLAAEAGKEVGLEFDHKFVGGGSDGNYVSRIVATLDGLGVHGNGAHTLEEYILIDQFIPRIAMVANFILKI
jgi:glutamate carboxypeptidase